MGLLTSIVSPFFSKVFISINIDASSCFVGVMRIKNGKTLESFTKEFKTQESKLPMDATKLIRQYKQKYPFTYVSALTRSLAQGIILRRGNKDVLMGSLKLADCQIVSKKSVEFYVKKNSLKDTLRRYDSVGEIDFIFSPFLIMCDNIWQHPTSGKNLYVLLQRNDVALIIARGYDIYFSSLLLVESGINSVREETRVPVEFKNFDNIVESDEFDDFSKMDVNFSLDNLQTDMFIPTIEDNNKITYDDLPKAPIITKIIADSLKEYYQNPAYDSGFIEKIVFLDACKMSDDVLEIITKDLMLESAKREIDLSASLIQFARNEVKE